VKKSASSRRVRRNDDSPHIISSNPSAHTINAMRDVQSKHRAARSPSSTSFDQPQRPSSPPPGELPSGNYRGHQRSNSGSYSNYKNGGHFIPENIEKEGRPRSHSARGGSMRSMSSTSSASSSGAGSIRSFASRNRDDESGLGMEMSQSSRSTFPRNMQPGQEPAEAKPKPSTFPRASAKARVSTADAAMGALALDAPHDASHNRGAPTRWKRGKLLGSGAFGNVYTCLDESTGHELAVKQVEIHSAMGSENLKEIQALEQEIRLLQDLRHRRIVTYYGTERTTTHLAIFMEYVPGRSIHTRLKEYGAFAEDIVKKYTRQVLEGLEYLHGKGIIHRDIKGANVLAGADGNIKLADFGSSKLLQKSIKSLHGHKSTHGTPYWMSPEAVLTDKRVGKETDIWSMACLVIEMFTKKPPFSEHEPIAAIFKIGQPQTDFQEIIPKRLSADARSFLGKCFNTNPRKRPTATQLLEEPFLK